MFRSRHEFSNGFEVGVPQIPEFINQLKLGKFGNFLKCLHRFQAEGCWIVGYVTINGHQYHLESNEGDGQISQFMVDQLMQQLISDNDCLAQVKFELSLNDKDDLGLLQEFLKFISSNECSLAGQINYQGKGVRFYKDSTLGSLNILAASNDRPTLDHLQAEVNLNDFFNHNQSNHQLLNH